MMTVRVALALLILLAASRVEAAPTDWLTAYESTKEAERAVALGIIGGITMTADRLVPCPARRPVDTDVVADDVADILRQNQRTGSTRWSK
jgi:hypothetical protein